MPVSIAIDGTASSGKGTVADILAQKLKIYHLDTGAIYRTVAYACFEDNVDYSNENEVKRVIRKNKIETVFENNRQINKLNGVDVQKKIRSQEISNISSIISTFVSVREFATKIQLNLAKNTSLIIEGRDIGTVVLPNANYKFFLTASPEIRARRRLIQNNLPESEFENVLCSIIERDQRDISRKNSPLRCADDAIKIDTSNLNAQQVADLMLSYIK